MTKPKPNLTNTKIIECETKVIITTITATSNPKKSSLSAPHLHSLPSGQECASGDGGDGGDRDQAVWRGRGRSIGMECGLVVCDHGWGEVEWLGVA